MLDLEKNRVYDIGEIETLKSTAVSLLSTGIDACISWDYSITELNTLQSQTPVKSGQLSSALSSVGTLYQSDYEVEKCWIEGSLNNIITNIPAQDAAGAQLLEPLSENLKLIMGMIEDLAGCIEAAGTNLSLSEFKQKVENVKQDWDNSTLMENLQEFETSFIGMLENTCYGADPVNMSTGNFVYRYTDLSTGGDQPLTFVRTYNAMSRHKGILGRCWSHNWEKCLKEKDNKLVLYHEDGRQETFVPEDTSGQIETERTEEKTARIYVSSLNRQAKIIQNREGKSLSVTGEGIFEYYDKDGYLFLLEDNKNSQTILEYEEDRLVRVYKKTGEELRFSYGDKDRLVEVRDHTGRTIHFSYEGKKLVKAEDPEGNAFTYEYGANGRISRILDKRNVPVLENEYDDYRRVLLQRFPDGGELRFDYQDKKKAVRLTEQNGSITTYVHDRKFRSKKTIFEDGYEEWEYDAEGRVKRKRDKNGNETFHAYDEKGRPTETTDPLGNKTTKTYDGRGRLTEILHPDGTKTSYAYDEKGRPVRMVNQEGEATLLSYENGESRPSHVTYADGSTMQLTYDAKGNILSIQYPDGTGMSYTYDALSRVTEAVDGNGNTTRIEYDGLDRIKGVKRADGARQSLTYNPMGEAVRIEDFDGYVSTWEYNEINKPVLYMDKQGRKTRMEYDKMWNLSRLTDPEGGITEYAYDKQKRLIQVKDPLGRSVRFSYDPNGNRTKVLYPDDTCMQYEYDALNRVVKETDRAGRTTLTEYDVMGNVSCTTDNAGNKTLYAYDACNRKIKETDRSGAVTEYTYTPLGKTDRILHPDGRMEQYHYGPGGRLDKQDKGDGTWETYAYDKNGSLIKKNCQDGRRYTYAYDCLNRVTEICLNGKPQKTYAYDAMGNIISVKDAAGRETVYRYSPMGKLLAITDAMGNRVFYSYNGRDELTGILQMEKDGKAEFLIPKEDRALLDEDWLRIKKHNEENHDLHLTLITRDAAGQITKMTDALGREDTYEYDCMGNVSRRMDQNGEETLWEYHADGQVRSITYPGGKKAVYAYDALARLSRIQDWLGETVFTYDKEGNLTESKDHNRQVMTYTYTPSRKRESVCYPDGSRTEYGYDAMGRVENIQCGALSLTYGYDEWGHLSRCKRSNGILTKLNYDTEGRIMDLIHEDENGILEAFHCGYDLTGNRIYLKRESSEEEYSFHKTYEYDTLDRLVTIKEDGNTAAFFVYDGYGNRIKECQYKNGQALSEGPQIRNLSYNALNQLTEDGENRYTYDVKGNLTEVKGSNGTVRRMTYDHNGCLMELYENEQLIQTNEYNGVGIRVERMIAGKRAHYVADYADPYHRTAAEYGENERGRNYLWHENTLLGIANEGMHVLTDLFHSPVRVMDKERTTQNLYAYDEYGILKKQKESIPFSFGFTGYLKETIPQLYFTGSREYNTRDGRFQSKDQYRYMDYQDPLSINLYAYAKNNPLKYIDYDGHECIEEKNYLERAFEMLIIAACSNGETAGRAALSTMGLDLPADFENLAACFTVNFNPGDLMWWANLADCAASFLPLVGESRFFGAGAGLLKYAYQSLQVEKETAYKATLGSEYYLNNESIPDPEDYWNRQDGYFSGSWWLDEDKKQEALNVLTKECLLAEGEAGGYDLMTHYTETEPGSAKRYALQLMFQLEPTNGDDETVLNNIAGACARRNIDLASNGWVIAPTVMMSHAEHHEQLQEECDTNEKRLLSFMLNFIPVVGEVKSAAEAITGKDMITQEELSVGERIIGLAAGFLDIAGIKGGITGGKKVVGEGAEVVGESAEVVFKGDPKIHPELDELEKFYEEIFEQQRTVFPEYEEYLEELKKLQTDPYTIIESGSKSSKGGTVPDFYVGPNGKALPSQYKDWIGTNIQKELLEQAENPQLQNAIKQLYRGNSFIGDGGTADVIRFEQQTGLMLGKNGGSHVQKGIDMAKYIENKILTQDLSPSDRALITQLLEDLYSALGR